MTGDEIVDAVVNQGSFDVTSSGIARTDVTGWCAEVYSHLVARSGWLRAVKTFATTAADDNEYAWPTDVVEQCELRDQDGRRYKPVTLDQLWDLEGGDAMLSVDASFAYALTFSSTGVRSMRLYPTPDADSAGLTLEGLATLYPPAFEDDAGFTPVLPEDYQSCIIDGAIRVGRRRVEEADAPMVMDEILANEIVALRTRKLAETPPPTTIPVFRRPR